MEVPSPPLTEAALAQSPSPLSPFQHSLRREMVLSGTSCSDFHGSTMTPS